MGLDFDSEFDSQIDAEEIGERWKQCWARANRVAGDLPPDRRLSATLFAFMLDAHTAMRRAPDSIDRVWEGVLLSGTHARRDLHHAIATIQARFEPRPSLGARLLRRLLPRKP